MKDNVIDEMSINDFWKQELSNWEAKNIRRTQQAIGRIFSIPYKWQPANKDDLQNAVDEWCEGIQHYGDIQNWDTSLITNMEYLFEDKHNFNDNIQNWNVEEVTSMEGMFYNARAFNQPLDGWNVINVQNMAGMFKNASSFNQNLDSWDPDVNDVLAIKAMFDGSAMEDDLPDWYQSIIEDDRINNLQ